MENEVSKEKIGELLRGMIEQIKESVAAGSKLPWNEPYFLGYFNAMVNAQEKTNNDGTPCPNGRPYMGIINSMFLIFGAMAAQKRNGTPKMDHRFVRRSSIFSKDKKWKIHSEATVKKGSKAIFVFYPIKWKKHNPNFDRSQPAGPKNPEYIYVSSGRWGGGYVFNLSDTNLVELGVFPELEKTTEKDNPSIEVLEKIICGFPQDYREAECVPHYHMGTKTITTPPLKNAKSSLAHYLTRCHELIHMLQDMVGDCKGRIDRGSYSKNELEAEMGAAYVLASLGFINQDSEEYTNSATYIQGWLEKLENDPQMLWDAAINATRFGNMILKGELPAIIKDREKFTFLPAESSNVETEERESETV